MLYLEDYLEMIEHLPQELRDRFTEMRELDLTVQNSMDSLEKKTRLFFLQCKRGELQNGAYENEYQNLRKEYYKVLEDADEKVAIATQIHELVERYLRRLDSELFKFKCELEADNNGITEILEKRSLELDGHSSSGMVGIGQKENRYFGSLASNNHSSAHSGIGLSGTVQPKDNRYRPKPEKRRNSINASLAVVDKRPNLNNSILVSAAAVPVAVVRPLTPNLGVAHNSVIAPAATPSATSSSVAYSLQHMGGAGNAIAAAASQAIVATQQMQQGRRTASLKASYEAIHGAASGSAAHEFWINRDLSGPATTQNSLASADRDAAGNLHTQQQQPRKQKKKLSSTLMHQTSSITSSAISVPSSSISSHVDSTGSSGDLPSSSSGSVGISIIGSNISSGSTLSSSASISNRNAVSAATSSVASTSANAAADNGLVEQTTEGEWPYDPNEPRYCTCNQVSYGDMVACDNDACPYEWFHYPCVGITQPPKGKWYCPKCTASMRRRGNRKN